MPSLPPLSLSRFLFSIVALLFPIALLATTWLYYYPAVQGCGFPTPVYTNGNAKDLGREAPFRLLALGDPQLEGSTSLPGGDGVGFKVFWERVVEKFEDSRGRWRNAREAEEWASREAEIEGEEPLENKFEPWSVPFLSGSFKYLKNGRALLQSDLAVLKDVLKEDVPLLLLTYRKRLDLWGNDYYLAHIVRTMRWWSKPTHVAVMGDLLGSQWISDEEFESRAGRYWNRVFAGMEKVPDNVIRKSEEWWEEAERKENHGVEKRWTGPNTEILGLDEEWERRVINVAGNHDIGYAGDLDEKRVERFEKQFGRVNWEIVFTLPPSHPSFNSSTAATNLPTENTPDSDSDSISASFLGSSKAQTASEIPALRLVMLNSMNLDTPAHSEALQAQTYDFLNHVISSSPPLDSRRAKTEATLLLTHIPLHKEPGICVDSPLFDFFENGASVREQNMLSDYVSTIVLEGIFALGGEQEHEGDKGVLGRKGLILNGHDHAGCDVLHWFNKRAVADTEPVSSDSANIESLSTVSTASTDSTSDSNTVSSDSPETESLQSPSTSSTDSTSGSETAAPEASETESIDNTPAPATDSASSSVSDADSKSTEEEPNAPPPPPPSPWQAHRLPSSPSTPSLPVSPLHAPLNTSSLSTTPHLREVTLRSMMGEYGGAAGLVSAWWDQAADNGQGEWKFEVSYCNLGVQHWWWGVHGLDIGVAVIGILGVVSWVVECVLGRKQKEKEGKKVEKVKANGGKK